MTRNTAWMSLNLMHNPNLFNTQHDILNWQHHDGTKINKNNIYNKEYLNTQMGGYGNDIEMHELYCTLLRATNPLRLKKTKMVPVIQNEYSQPEPVQCNANNKAEIGICGTYGFFSNEYRTFVFNMEENINEISIINLFIENDKNDD
eukprot:171199_1